MVIYTLTRPPTRV